MSSTRYWAELHPDTRLRRLVVFSAAAFGALGVAMVVTLPLHAAARLAAAATWLLLCVREWLRLRRGFSYCRRLRVSAGGEVLLLDPEGVWQPARLLPGSMVLRRFGWLLLETGRGHRCTEPLRGRCRENDDWRRLQVIWRHIGGTP